MGGVREASSTLPTHPTPPTPLAYSSAMSRFISLNLSVFEGIIALALRLPLFNYESGKLQLKEIFHGFDQTYRCRRECR
jgi:hypothetical protein